MKKIFQILTAVIFLYPVSAVYAVNVDCEENTKYIGEVADVEEEECEGMEEGICRRYTVEILEGDFEGETVTTEIMSTSYGYSDFSEGDRVYVSGMCYSDTDVIWTIEGYYRESSIFFLLGFFVLIVFLVSGREGLGSILGLAVSFGIIYFFMIPNAVNTQNVLLWGLISIFFVLIASIYLSHGFNRKSTIALLCTIAGLIILALFALIFISSAKLTGFGSEEVFLLVFQLGGGISVKEILYIGILLSGIGVLDDVTVSQVGTVIELSKANMNMKTKDLFKASMNVGKDHISSMVNTLFIAYAGASLSLVMLMNATGMSWSDIVNSEFFAEEIVRAVISSMGLVLVVPITAYVSSSIVPSLVRNHKV